MERIQRCAIYIRVSTAEQMIHGKSLQAQKEYLEQYAADHDMSVVGIYADEGKTARKELKKRKAIHSLLEDVKKDKIDVILFWRLDRWFRSISDFYKVQDVLDEHGVRWISTSEPGINMETRDGRLQLNVVLSIGQNEVDTTSERIKFVNESSIRQGKLIFGDSNMPSGYMTGFVNGKKCMIKNPEEEEMVNAFFDYFEKTKSKQATLSYIQSHYNSNFSYTMMRSMFNKEFYKGTYRGIPYCPAYLSDERWEKINRLAERTIKKTPSGRVYYFSGMIRCPFCGQLLAGNGCKSIINRKTGEKRDYCYYRCNKALVDKLCQNRKRISQNLIESYLIENLQKEYEKYKIRIEGIQQKKKKEKLKRTSDQINKEQVRLNMLFQKGRIEWEYYNEEYEKLENELKEVTIMPKPQETDFSYIENILSNENFKEMYEELSLENKRSFWQNTIKQIHLTENGEVKYVDFL